MDTLNDIFYKYGSDKGPARTQEGKDEIAGHMYGDFYERKLFNLRNKSITILEIGLCNTDSGVPSLMAWHEWFPKANIIGIDIRDFTRFKADNIQIFQVDQSNEKAISDFASLLEPFDVIIDDGSHNENHILTSFKVLLPHTKQFYFIEDIHPNKQVMQYLESNRDSFKDIEWFTTWKVKDPEGVICVEINNG